jgi:hypothetical protein
MPNSFGASFHTDDKSVLNIVSKSQTAYLQDFVTCEQHSHRLQLPPSDGSDTMQTRSEICIDRSIGCIVKVARRRRRCTRKFYLIFPGLRGKIEVKMLCDQLKAFAINTEDRRSQSSTG